MKWYYYIITLAVALAGMSAVFPLNVDEHASLGVVKTAEELKKNKFDTILATSKIDTENKNGNLTKDELVELKSYAIVQKTKLGKFSKSTYEIEIVEISQIDGGIQVFARAWKNGVQLGFGKDGTIDIERFRIFNPPILVDDPLGDIVYPATTDPQTGMVTPERRLREDLTEAVQQSLTHTISITGKEGTNIVAGKRGNTTSTFYSGAGDGSVGGNNATWATIRDASSGGVDYTSVWRYLFADLDAGTYSVSRQYFPFDTSAIPDSDSISSATFSADSNSGEGSRSAALIQTTTASTATLTGADYIALTVNTPTEGTASRVAMTSAGYANFVMNASGLGWINKTGFTKLGLRLSNDVDNSAPTVRNYTLIYHSEETGTTHDPKLVVVHSAGAPASSPANQNFILFE